MTSGEGAGRIRENAVLESAGAGVWHWSRALEILHVSPGGGGPAKALAGDWALADACTQFEGLSAARLTSCLTGAGEGSSINLNLTLADGRSLRMVGSFTGNEAQGLLLGDTGNLVAAVSLEDGLEAAFQPIISLKTGKVAGFEALARWRTSNGKLQSVGMMNGDEEALVAANIAPAMLTQAAELLADLRRDASCEHLIVQVNLTGADLFSAQIHTLIGKLIAEKGLSGDCLRVELTEQAALRNFDAGVAAASALAASGVSLILDDFGSGHSSLAWLASLPVTGLKLDPHLVGMAGVTRADTVLKGIVSLARDMGLSVTAEGIEEPGQVAFLQEIGCTHAQGYAFGHPMSREQLAEWLDAN